MHPLRAARAGRRGRGARTARPWKLSTRHRPTARGGCTGCSSGWVAPVSRRGRARLARERQRVGAGEPEPADRQLPALHPRTRARSGLRVPRGRAASSGNYGSTAGSGHRLTLLRAAAYLLRYVVWSLVVDVLRLRRAAVRRALKMTIGTLGCSALAASALPAVGYAATSPRVAQHARPAATADPVVAWNRFVLDLQATPGVQSATIHPTYELAIVHAAIYDAVVSIDRSAAPYFIQVHG